MDREMRGVGGGCDIINVCYGCWLLPNLLVTAAPPRAMYSMQHVAMSRHKIRHCSYFEMMSDGFSTN
jgi:hypothetical protein